MKTSKQSPRKFSQKGAGMLEYALLFGFVAAVFLIVFAEGGFDDTMGDLFGSSSDSLASVEFNSDSGGGGGGGGGSSSVASLIPDSTSDTTSTAQETSAVEESTPVTYKPLNWVGEVLPFADITYNTIARSDTTDKALSSEIGFFETLLTFVDGHLASTNAADGTKDWETFLSIVNNTKAKNNVASSYVRDEQKITVKTVGKDLRITYADKENSYYYKLSPDANNVMQIETNSNKSYSEFFKTVIKDADGGGWKYGD